MRHLPEADDGNHAAQEAVGFPSFTTSPTTRRDMSRKSPVLAGSCTSAILLITLVADGGDEPLEPGFAGALAALREHDVVALAPAGDHGGDELGRILQVHIHHDDRVAAGILEAGERGHGLADAAGEFQELDALVGAAVFENDRLGAVRGRIHREDHLIIRGDRGQDGLHPAEELGDIFLLPVDGTMTESSIAPVIAEPGDKSTPVTPVRPPGNRAPRGTGGRRFSAGRP
jgi:hypothetical protein